MSYSFNIRAANKMDAVEALILEFNKVVEQQPAHKQDKDQALNVASAFVGILPDDPTKDVAVNCSGYLSWDAVVDGKERVTAANVYVTASLVAK